MFRSQYLCDFQIRSQCQGPPEEECDKPATRILIMAEPGEDDVEVTAVFVCDVCAIVWHGMFTEKDQV